MDKFIMQNGLFGNRKSTNNKMHASQKIHKIIRSLNEMLNNKNYFFKLYS